MTSIYKIPFFFRLIGPSNRRKTEIQEQKDHQRNKTQTIPKHTHNTPVNIYKIPLIIIEPSRKKN